MDAFINKLRQHDLENSDSLSRGKMTTLQVNLGNLCNQSCVHCHIEASPDGKNIMSKEVINDILGFLSRHKMKTLDITGGAPEMNPNFEYFVEKARGLVDELIVRSNLTVLTDEKYKLFPELFKKHNVHLICSMPCYLQQNVDSQRGINVFKKSVLALKILNELGFANQKDVLLDLVYNPVGASLPPSQEELERDYKKILSIEHGVNFNRLITITNVPIKRFKNYLESKGEYIKYRTLLEDNFNPDIIGNIMCRTFLSVAYDGKIYDCDFNQALGLAIKNKDGVCLTIKDLDPDSLEGNEIILGEHCLSCMAGSGSSCQGALTGEDQKVENEIEKQETK
ncbi:MAG: arsenosugar biosynthesis radical SAM protein ArsS [Candidatus Omnitrophica bacterium]|nr:arsenosugar biosynthesis radical SAM protein ArsS [Candidatus Omnitrophota bacterium]